MGAYFEVFFLLIIYIHFDRGLLAAIEGEIYLEERAFGGIILTQSRWMVALKEAGEWESPLRLKSNFIFPQKKLSFEGKREFSV